MKPGIAATAWGSLVNKRRLRVPMLRKRLSVKSGSGSSSPTALRTARTSSVSISLGPPCHTQTACSNACSASQASWRPRFCRRRRSKNHSTTATVITMPMISVPRFTRSDSVDGVTSNTNEINRMISASVRNPAVTRARSTASPLSARS